MFTLGILFAFVASALGATTICYDPCGCFSDEQPFDNLPLPESPEQIEIQFRLFTRLNQGDQDYIVVDYNSPPPSQWDASRRTVFMVHGWQDFGANYDDTKNRYLELADVNVVVVNWEGGSVHLDYWLSASDTRVVGGCSAALATHWINNYGASIDNMYCIGLSLGGQSCGFMGHATNGTLGRITAQDPAGPAFEKPEPESRLDKTDAVFVDTIHSDGFELGLGYDVSHADFYPNNGVDPQPPCIIGVCSHIISRDYYAASLDVSRGCTFRARPCNSTVDSGAGLCETCQDGVNCQRMGHYAETMPGTGSFFLRTVADYPYCEDPARK